MAKAKISQVSKVEVAENLQKNDTIKTSEEFLSVVATGTLPEAPVRRSFRQTKTVPSSQTEEL